MPNNFITTMPLRSIPQPVTGHQLMAWAREFTPRFGLDLVEMVRDWGRRYHHNADITKWSIADVIDCNACIAKELDDRGLLQLPPEARAQMRARAEGCQPRDAGRPSKGPLTLQALDPLLPVKKEIVRDLKTLYREEHGRDPTEEQAMDYLRVRCRDHSIVPPDSLRDLHQSSDVRIIRSLLREDLAEMRRFS